MLEGEKEKPRGTEEEAISEEQFVRQDDAATASSTIAEVFGEWSGGTSIHGLPYMFMPFFAWKRIAWLIFTLAATGVLAWQVSVIILQYLEYGTNVVIGTSFPKGLQFPDVTVCGANPFNVNWAGAGNIDYPRNDDELRSTTPNVTRVIIETETHLGNVYSDQNLTEVWKEAITSFGRCWRYVPPPGEELSDRVGEKGGLQFAVFLDPTEELPSTNVAGLFLFTNQPGVPVVSETPSTLFLEPGLQFVSMELTRYDRVTMKPWSTCTTKPGYSQAVCRVECTNRKVEKECGCRLMGVESSSDLDYCDVTGANSCHLNVDLTQEEYAACDCNKPPCVEYVYDSRRSQARLSDIFLDSLEEGIGANRTEINQRFMYVQVNFAELKLNHINETISMTRNQLLSNIGGQMGLFIGISGISLVEVVVELFGLRLFPRLWGERRLLGLGGKE